MTKKSLSKGCKVSLAFEKPINENYPIKKLKKENNTIISIDEEKELEKYPALILIKKTLRQKLGIEEIASTC